MGGNDDDGIMMIAMTSREGCKQRGRGDDVGFLCHSPLFPMNQMYISLFSGNLHDNISHGTELVLLCNSPRLHHLLMIICIFSFISFRVDCSNMKRNWKRIKKG